MDQKKKLLSVVIPTYNEEANVTAMTETLRNVFEKELPEYDYEIIYIDNHSKDGTRQILRKLCAKDSRVKAIFNAKNFGQMRSPVHGLKQAYGDAVIRLNVDFQDPPTLIPEFVHKWEEGNKIVIGIKNKTDEGKFIGFVRQRYYKLLRKITDIGHIENFTGFGLYDNDFLNILRRLDDPTPFLRGIVAEYGYKRKDIKYCQAERRAGKTHNNWVSLFDGAMLSATSYTRVGVRLAVCAGFALTCFNLLLALAYIIVAICVPAAWNLWVIPILIAIFLVGSVLMFFTGFVGEYVISVSKRVTNRPLVVEERRLNWEKKD